jgi:predicted ester cyclase
MSTEANQALVQHFIREIFEKKNIAALDRFLAPGYVDHFLPPGLPPGLAGNRMFFTGLFHAFPDLKYTVEDIIVSGDKVVCRDTICATHRGEYLGIAATGRSVNFSGMCIIRVEGDKLAEHWHEVDRLGLVKQLTDVKLLTDAIPLRG